LTGSECGWRPIMRLVELRVLALVALAAAGPPRDDEAHLAGCVRCAQHGGVREKARAFILGDGDVSALFATICVAGEGRM
jgi:hypothetical protein